MNPFQISVEDLNLSIDEQKSYPRWYTDLLLRKGKQSVAIGDTLSFVDNFGLREIDKQHILSIFGDPLVTLEPPQFYIFIRLASHLLLGETINPSLVYLQAPVPKPKSILSRKRKKEVQSPNLTGSNGNAGSTTPSNLGNNPFRRTTTLNADDSSSSSHSKPQKLDIDSFTKFILTGSMPTRQSESSKSDYDSDDADRPSLTSRKKKRVTFNSAPPQVAEAAARSMEELLRQKGLQHEVELIPPKIVYNSSSSGSGGPSSSSSYYTNQQPPEDDEPDVEIDNTFKNVNIDSVLYHGVSNVTPDQDHFRFSDVISPSPSPPLYNPSPLTNNHTGNTSGFSNTNMTSIASIAGMMAPGPGDNSGSGSNLRGTSPSPIPFTTPKSSDTPPLPTPPPPPPPPPRPRSDSRPTVPSSLSFSSITAQNNFNNVNNTHNGITLNNGNNGSNNLTPQHQNEFTVFHTGSSSSLLNQPFGHPSSNSPLSSAPPSISSTPTLPNQQLSLRPLQPQHTRSRPVPLPMHPMNNRTDLPTIAPPPPQSRRVGSAGSVSSGSSVNGTLTNGLSLQPQQTHSLPSLPAQPTQQPFLSSYTTSPPPFPSQATYHPIASTAPPLPPRQPSPMFASPTPPIVGGLAPPPPPPTRRRAPSLPPLPQGPQYRSSPPPYSSGISTPPTLGVPSGFMPHRATPLGQQMGYTSSAPDLLSDLKALQDEVDRINAQG